MMITNNRVLAMLKNVFLLIMTLCITSCSIFSPVKTEDNTYVLSSLPAPMVKRRHHYVLMVSAVDSLPMYNTAEMAYTTEQYQIAYYSKNRWAATPAQMLQPLIIQSLQNTRYFAAVDSASAVSYDYLLNTQLLELRQIFYGNTSVERLSVRVQLVNGATGRVVAEKEMTATSAAPFSSPYGGVIAANRVTRDILQQIVRFCLHAIR